MLSLSDVFADDVLQLLSRPEAPPTGKRAARAVGADGKRRGTDETRRQVAGQGPDTRFDAAEEILAVGHTKRWPPDRTPGSWLA